ncbi:MAG: hypothetical protein ACKV2T_12225 [Kofleriaceae bacterium]
MNIELELAIGEGVTRRASCDAKGVVTVRDPDGTTIATARWADGKLGEKRILKSAVTRGQWGQIEGRLIVAARHARSRDLKESGDHLNFVIDPDGEDPPKPIKDGVKLTAGVWKVRVDKAGTLVITALHGEHLVIVATALWSEAKITSKQIKNGTVSKAQWERVRRAIDDAWKERVQEVETRRAAMAREADTTSTPYVTFLIDLADGDDDRLIEGTLRAAPCDDPPTGPFVWKVACDTKGGIQIWSLGMKQVASATWRGALVSRRQPSSAIPTTYQWSLVEQALALAFERRHESPPVEPPAPPVVDESPSPAPDPSFRAFLLDIRDGTVVDGSVRFEPDPELVPDRVFVWEVTLSGTTVLVQDRDGDRLATGTWQEGLVDTAQSGSVPTDAQWAMVRAALHRVANVPEPEGSRPHANRSVSATRSTPKGPSVAHTPRSARSSRKTLTIVGVFGAIIVTVIVVAVIVGAHTRARVTGRTPIAAPAPSRAHTPRTPPTPTPPPSPPTPPETLGTRLAEHRLRWVDVAVPPETTIERAEKEPEDEKGKRLCVDGTVDSITRADQGLRRLYSGAITTKVGDRVTFLVGGTTGPIVKRSEVTLCGVVTGFADGTVALEGMFDLPENRNPIVEKD